ncbi:MAG: hypothetical protein ACP5NO_06990 [Thermoplasmata archaeon]
MTEENFMRGMVKSLAAMPEEQREVMLTDRMKDFLNQKEDERRASMRSMLIAALSLEDNEYLKISATRTRVILSLDQDDRSKLMEMHIGILASLDPSMKQKEIGTMKKVVMELPDQQREVIRNILLNHGIQL